MADVDTGTEPREDEEQDTEGNDDAQNDSSNDSGDGRDDASSDDDDSSDDDSDDSSDDEDDDDDSEPVVRKDPSFYVGLRKGRKEERDRQKQKGGSASYDDSGDDDDSDDDSDDEIDPRDKEVVKEIVQDAIKPLVERQMKEEDEKELNGFLSENPDFKPFEKKIRRFMAHPSRAHLPIKTIAYEVAGDKLLSIGARRAREADADGQQTEGAGSSSRTQSKGGSVWEQDSKSFEEKQQEVRRKARG